MSDIQRFTDQHRLKTSIDEDGTKTVPGRDGQLYEHDANVLAVIYRPKVDAWKPKTWGNNRRACLALGFTLLQDGDSEGSLSFDADNPQQAKLAIKVAGISPRRRLSDEQRERLRSIGGSSRFASGTAQERPLGG